jgi:hypothetical protein
MLASLPHQTNTFYDTTDQVVTCLVTRLSDKCFSDAPFADFKS